MRLDNFILTAGKAGTHSSYYGGGGGGVLVNGKKPSGTNSHWGEGYGGGGYNSGAGFPGCVLIDL